MSFFSFLLFFQKKKNQPFSIFYSFFFLSIFFFYYYFSIFLYIWGYIGKKSSFFTSFEYNTYICTEERTIYWIGWRVQTTRTICNASEHKRTIDFSYLHKNMFQIFRNFNPWLAGKIVKGLSNIGNWNMYVWYPL